MKYFKIAEIGFGFNTVSPVADSDYYSRFSIDENEFNSLKSKHYFDLCAPESLPQPGDTVFAGADFAVKECDNGWLKVSDRYENGDYKALCFQTSEQPGGKIAFTENAENKERTAAELFRLIDFTSSLLYYKAILLHGSVVEYKGKAYVFSGDSGVGKSTQAELWRKYHNAKILNGDRVILRRINNEWRAFGVPMCGSSEICEDFNLPLASIIFLGKGEQNNIDVPNLFYATVYIISQVNCGVRKKDDSERIIALSADIAGSVKIIHYECTPDKKAADDLKNYFDR